MCIVLYSFMSTGKYSIVLNFQSLNKYMDTICVYILLTGRYQNK